ncbi:MAG: FmdB family transcriptional regulator [Candidatus Eremiobacteraeota bacterium]|nr:FmdB family transcriptional regulator [Candidatus Eremiobacteraeota bacterium]MBV8373681.1 FmdB family transcriptional regulator [Candidatus Eremiobacteraeota bacterium]
MPLYEYKCAQCGKHIEVRHGFNERHREPCPACGGTLTRVFNPSPIVFKGSGFYATDSRKTPEKAPATKTETAKSEPAASDSAKPEPAPASTEKPAAGSTSSESAA